MPTHDTYQPFYDDFWTHPRFEALVELLGDDEKAAGKCLKFWRLARKYWGEGRKLIPLEIWALRPQLHVLAQIGIAAVTPQGVSARNPQQYFDWQFGRKRGGQARATGAQRGPDGRFLRKVPAASGDSEQSVPPHQLNPRPAPAPPSSVQLELELELRKLNTNTPLKPPRGGGTRTEDEKAPRQEEPEAREPPPRPTPPPKPQEPPPAKPSIAVVPELQYDPAEAPPESWADMAPAGQPLASPAAAAARTRFPPGGRVTTPILTRREEKNQAVQSIVNSVVEALTHKTDTRKAKTIIGDVGWEILLRPTGYDWERFSIRAVNVYQRGGPVALERWLATPIKNLMPKGKPA